ncbi:MAG TPA: DUF4240 domain-containing protein [Verrucomicrobiae bacterium]|nr:DUF4240 domain-containing protein [Verrucomicrobiae bacterium]
MTEALFWDLIDKSAKECNNDAEQQSQWLARRLSEFTLADIFEFQEHLIRRKRDAYDGRLMAALAVLDDMDDDDFQDFRLWLVSRGKAVFEKCLNDPEALAGIVEPGDWITASDIGEAAAKAYEQVTGRDDFHLRFQLALPPPELKNALVWQTREGYADPSKLRVLFPRLWEKFGERFQAGN